MFTFFTTTTGPAWDLSVANEDGEILDVAGASYNIWFVSVTNNQKVQGNGTWFTIDGPNGHFQYHLSSTDLASAYAVQSSIPGKYMFDVCVQAIIGTKVYDALPNRIIIRKI